MVIFFLLLGIVIISIILIAYQKSKNQYKKNVYFGWIFSLIICIILLPLYDPLILRGFLASAIQGRYEYSVFGLFAGLISINIAIYASWIFMTSIELQNAERYKGKLITIKQYGKRRHPIFASYHIIGSSYFVIMGAPICLIIFSIIMIFINIEAKRIDEQLSRKFGEKYQTFKKQVPRRIYSADVLCLVIINYSLLIVGIIGLVFFSYL